MLWGWLYRKKLEGALKYGECKGYLRQKMRNVKEELRAVSAYTVTMKA